MEELVFAINQSTPENIWDTITKRNLNNRRIIVNQDIDDSMLELICLNILDWNREDKDIPIKKRKPIYILINSYGGDVFMGNQIIGSIQQSITPVITVGFSMCASMASYILAAGHTRYCFPNTIVLLHDGELSISSSTNKVRDFQNFYDDFNESMNDFWLENTKMTKEFLDEITDREYYMFAKEAKERGLVDKIIGVDCKLDEIL